MKDAAPTHPVLKLVWEWLAAARELQEQSVQAELDEAVEESFPASDPIAPHATKKRAVQIKQVNCTMSKGRLVLRWASEGLAKSEQAESGEPVATIDTVDPSNCPVRVKVFVCD